MTQPTTMEERLDEDLGFLENDPGYFSTDVIKDFVRKELAQQKAQAIEIVGNEIVKPETGESYEVGHNNACTTIIAVLEKKL